MFKYFTIPFTVMGSSCEVKLYTHDSQSANVVAGTVVDEVKRLKIVILAIKKIIWWLNWSSLASACSTLK